jgi:hypothetical protein
MKPSDLTEIIKQELAKIGYKECSKPGRDYVEKEAYERISRFMSDTSPDTSSSLNKGLLNYTGFRLTSFKNIDGKWNATVSFREVNDYDDFLNLHLIPFTKIRIVIDDKTREISELTTDV